MAYKSSDGHLAIVELPIHFDVPINFFDSDDYVIAIESLRTSLAEFNKRLFGSQYEFELVILANEDGSFLAKTGVLVRYVGKATGKTLLWGGLAVGTTINAVSFSETDTFKGLIKGVTGHDIKHYQAAETAGIFLKDFAEGFYSKETEDLEKLIPDELNLDKAFKAKTDFYGMCLHNPIIKGVGFDNAENFPIKRQRFAHHTSKDRTRPLAPERLIQELIIVSPVDIASNMKWSFLDKTTGQIIKAHMRDDIFKRGFLNGKYPLKQSKADDRLTALVEYERQEKNGEIDVIGKSIHTVHSFNDEIIKPLPRKHNELMRRAPSDERPMDSIWARTTD